RVALRGHPAVGPALRGAGPARAGPQGTGPRSARFPEASPPRANLSRANLSRANLSRANLSRASPRGAGRPGGLTHTRASLAFLSRLPALRFLAASPRA